MIIFDDELVKNPLVTVIVFTYNQEQFISQTIDSILTQKTDFSYEIIVGDDFSTDKTREILFKYQNDYKSKIKLILQEQNLGIVGNYSETIKHCRGKYIAQCAGDDYWIDNLKLKKQVDFLENHRDYVLIHTNGYQLYKGNLIPLQTWGKMEGDVQETFWYGSIITTCTPCFRSELLNHVDFNDIIKRGITTEDWATYAIFSKYGKFAFINEKCVVKRTNSLCVSVSKNYYLFYHLGLINIKRYLRDVVFPLKLDEIYSEIVLNKEEVYYRMRKAFMDFNYASAKLLVSDKQMLSKKANKYARFTKNRILFIFAATVKKIIPYFKRNMVLIRKK